MHEDADIARKLPRCGEWIGALVTFPSYVRDGDEAPYRPTAVMWLEADTGLVIDSQLVRPEDALPRAPGLFHYATREPAEGEPRKPRRLRVADEALAHALRPTIGDVELVVAPTPEMDEVVASMTAHFEQRQRAEEEQDATYLASGVEPDVVADMFAAAARLYRARPWDVIPADAFVAVSCEALGIDEGAISVVGQMGQSFGFAVFRTVSDAEQFLKAAESGDRRSMPPQMMFHFDDRAEMPGPMLREIAQYGWEVAGPRGFPWAVVVDEDLVSRSLTRGEVIGVTAVAAALALLVERTPQLAQVWETGERVGCSPIIETSQGDVAVTVAAPLWLDVESASEDGEVDEAAAAVESLVRPDGSLDTELFEDHFEALMSRFAATNEAGEEVLALAEMLVEYAAYEVGATVVGMTPAELEKLLFVVVPKRAVIDAEAAPLIVEAMRGLLTLAERELGSTTAGACLAALDDAALKKLVRALGDDRKFGQAKSLFVAGQRAGFDMTTEAGISAFVDAMNASAPPRGRAKSTKTKTKTKAAKATGAKKPATAKPATGKAAKAKPAKGNAAKAARPGSKAGGGKSKSTGSKSRDR